jgi:hypothetical protein
MDPLAKRAATLTAEMLATAFFIGVLTFEYPWFGLLWIPAVFFFIYAILREAQRIAKEQGSYRRQ